MFYLVLYLNPVTETKEKAKQKSMKLPTPRIAITIPPNRKNLQRGEFIITLTNMCHVGILLTTLTCSAQGWLLCSSQSQVSGCFAKQINLEKGN